MKKKVKINFTDFWHPDTPEEIKKNNLFKFLSKRFDLELSKDPDFLIYSCFGNKFLKYKCVRIFYTGENIRPNLNECDYAFSFDYPVTERNYRLPLYKLYREFDNLKKERKVSEITPLKKNFCNFVYSKKRAKERIKFYNELQKYKKIDSGGKVLNNIGYLVGDKIEFLRHFKFTIAFENSSYPGYTTEKIIHAFVANTIPIYWGNPLINRDFNPKSFINCHNYKSFNEVIERIIEVDNNDELYLRYLMEPPFYNNMENEYVKEENIYKRFETIFSNKNTTYAAKNTDFLRLYTHPLYIKNKYKQIINFLSKRHSS